MKKLIVVFLFISGLLLNAQESYLRDKMILKSDLLLNGLGEGNITLEHRTSETKSIIYYGGYRYNGQLLSPSLNSNYYRSKSKGLFVGAGFKNYKPIKKQNRRRYSEYMFKALYLTSFDSDLKGGLFGSKKLHDTERVGLRIQHTFGIQWEQKRLVHDFFIGAGLQNEYLSAKPTMEEINYSSQTISFMIVPTLNVGYNIGIKLR